MLRNRDLSLMYHKIHITPHALNMDKIDSAPHLLASEGLRSSDASLNPTLLVPVVFLHEKIQGQSVPPALYKEEGRNS